MSLKRSWLIQLVLVISAYTTGNHKNNQNSIHGELNTPLAGHRLQDVEGNKIKTTQTYQLAVRIFTANARVFKKWHYGQL